MTRQEVAEWLGVTATTVANMEARGMPVIRYANSNPLYVKEEVVEWIKKQQRSSMEGR